MVPHLMDLREEILREFHCSRFAVHPGGKKMYVIFVASITGVGIRWRTLFDGVSRVSR